MPKTLQIIYIFFKFNIALYYFVCYNNTMKGDNNMKDYFKTKYGTAIERNLVIFEADDVNDPDWKPIIECLMNNGFKVYFASGNWMNIVIDEKDKNL